MKKITLGILLSFLISVNAFPQSIFNTPNTYRTNSNPYYWKNRPPHAAYWQQDVHYEINAVIDDSTDIIHGKDFRLSYWNNSPDTLNELYFHLYQNAFQPGSHYHDLNNNNHVKTKFGKYEAQGLGTVIENLSVNGNEVITILDNTVLKVILNRPLLPADSVIIQMSFKTYFDTGTLRRRMKMFNSFGYKHYDGVHWFPAICVYDRKFGWNTDQHLDKEFYNNFGTYDVALTFPQEYVVEATGNLVNRNEVLPDTLRKKLELKNFATKPFGEAPSVITPKVAGATKTWIYHAENVHTFAFTADPLYRIGELEWNGIKIITLAQEPNASRWQASGWFTTQVIKTYSLDFGMYAWPKIIVADAKDGMEYPMLTLDNGIYPNHQSLLAHEVGHMWFYGMVGSNETYRAFLDEGFTQFLTVWSMDKILSPIRQRISKSKHITKYIDSSNTKYENLYYPYLNHVTTGFDEPLNTHSSAFNGALRHGGNYGLVYYKTGVMLYNLKYVLGDDLFLNAMKHYFHKWKFAHPYPEDFRDAIIEYTHADLNWFFDEWLETTKYIDYSVKKIKRINETGTYQITFQRKGRMQMPIDFTVTGRSGKTYAYHIPNTWFTKQTIATVLPKWFGWDLLHPEYEASINIGEEIKSVQIDPSLNLADADLTNNKKKNNGISTLQLDHRVPNLSRWDKQRNYWRPDIWYNNFDGLQVGLHTEGNYFNKYTYSATVWYNTRLLNSIEDINLKRSAQPVAMNIAATRDLSKLWKETNIELNAYYNAGIYNFNTTISKTFRKQDQRNPRYIKFFISPKYLMNDLSYQQYLLYPDQWGISGQHKTFINASINYGLIRNYTYTKGSGNMAITLRTPFVGSDYNYSYLSLNSVNHFNIKKFEFHSRVYGRYGIGTQPLESSLYLSGASPEEMIDNKYTRATGFFPAEWGVYASKTNPLQYGGGLNLRGYAGYLSPEAVKTQSGADSLVYTYNGKSGASINLEIDFDRYIKIKPKGITKNLKMDTYLFADAGFMVYELYGQSKLGSIRMDAGIGSALTVKFSPYMINPLVIRFDMPLFLNRPPSNSDFFTFRYLISINRAF